MKLNELLEIKDIGKFSKQNIFYIILSLHLLSILYYMTQFSLGTEIGEYMSEHNKSVIYAPIYEEVLFRGVILLGLLKIFKTQKQVIIWGGILFGIWHLNNFPYMTFSENIQQVVYTAFLGLLFTWLTLKYKTIWLGVMLHYVNNLFLHPVSWFLVGYFS